MAVKAIQLLINSKLPEELRDYNRVPDGKNLNDLLTRVAQEMPDRYEEIVHSLATVGRNAAYTQGNTLRLSDLRPVIDKDGILASMDMELQTLKDTLSDADYKKARLAVWNKYSTSIEDDTKAAALANGNNLGYSVASGARGNPAQLKAMISTPGLYADSKGNTVPMFIRHSFAQGLRPAELLAGSYGARSSVVSTKAATARGGDLGKQLVAGAAGIMVTEQDCGTANGIDLPVDEPSLRGRVLAKDIAGLKAGTVIDKETLAFFKKNKVEGVIAKSTLTCAAKGGVCSKCCGKWMDGKFPKIGFAIGTTAAQAVSEPITQGSLNLKHLSGAASSKKEFSGFGYLNQFVQSPDSFPDRASVAELDGTVTKIEEAPQGGKYITVGDKQHYVLPGFDTLVKEGEQVEAGDQLSDGLINPRDVVRLKGIGAGRRYYSDRMRKILNDSSYGGDLRNVEVLARANVDHVAIEDPDLMDGFEDLLPDDVVSYNKIAADWQPPKDTKKMNAKQSTGMFLQVPALHYTIGTRITPKVAAHMDKAGYNEIYASPTKPAFTSELPNLRTASHKEDDWIAQQYSSYLGGQMLDSAVRGRDTDIGSNTHFAPRLAVGVGFGKDTDTTGKF